MAENDLSYVKPGTLVFINVHAPVFNQTDKGGGNAEDAESLKEIVALIMSIFSPGIRISSRITKSHRICTSIISEPLAELGGPAM